MCTVQKRVFQRRKKNAGQDEEKKHPGAQNTTYVWRYDLGYMFGSIPFYTVSGIVLTVTVNNSHDNKERTQIIQPSQPDRTRQGGNMIGNN